ncbi:MAG TPA: hypothetical protein DGQ94_11385, partial [Pseudomonas sp.]|nr:hypothetical protein [Pseudomonas sp.]
RSHRYRTMPTACGVPVGAGVPAKRPAQENSCYPKVESICRAPIWHERVSLTGYLRQEDRPSKGMQLDDANFSQHAR